MLPYNSAISYTMSIIVFLSQSFHQQIVNLLHPYFPPCIYRQITLSLSSLKVHGSVITYKQSIQQIALIKVEATEKCTLQQL